MRRVDVTGKIAELSAPKDVQTKFGPGQTASAKLVDDSGEVKLILWNEKIAEVAVGKTVTVENGYVDSYQGVMQLNVGRYGKLKVN